MVIKKFLDRMSLVSSLHYFQCLNPAANVTHLNKTLLLHSQLVHYKKDQRKEKTRQGTSALLSVNGPAHPIQLNYQAVRQQKSAEV